MGVYIFYLDLFIVGWKLRTAPIHRSVDGAPDSRCRGERPVLRFTDPYAPAATARSTGTISYVLSISALSFAIAPTEQYFSSDRWIASSTACSAMSTPVTT